MLCAVRTHERWLELMKHAVKGTTRLVLAAFGLAAAALFAAEPTPETPAPLRVGVTADMPPMIFKQGKEFVGVEADLAQKLGRELGRPIKFVELDWPDLIDSLEADKIDIVMSSMSVTRARQTRVTFSEPYLRVGQMALVRADEKFRYSTYGLAIVDQRLGSRKGTTGDLLVQQEFPRAKRKYYDSGDDAANALLKKKIDLYFGDSTLIWYLAGKYESQGLVAAPMVFSDETLAWAMRKSDEALQTSVNKALKKLNDSGEVKKVLARWIPRFE